MCTGVKSSKVADTWRWLRHAEVQSALTHPLYDVRAATLKALLAQSAGLRDPQSIPSTLGFPSSWRAILLLAYKLHEKQVSQSHCCWYNLGLSGRLTIGH